MATDLQLAYAGLTGKQERYDLLWRYYDGDHPLVYNASKLREVFRDLDAGFNENWSAVVVNTILDRISIERFQIGDGRDEGRNDALLVMWRESGLDLASYDAHLCTLVTGEAFIVCGEGDDGPEAYFNDSRLAHMVYEDARPNTPRFAAKWWEEAAPNSNATLTRLTLYYADRFEYYVAHAARADIGSAAAFEPAELPTAPNPYGEIPVYHLRRELRAIVSELADVIAPQAQLNKMLADMMIAAEFGAYRQRYIISQVASGVKLRNAPNEIWDLPASDGEGQATSVGEFSATDLGNYLAAIERSANVIATISGIPKTLLFETGNIPSGASLRALEAPLVRKAERYANRWESVWRRVARWLMGVTPGTGAVQVTDIDVVWAEPATTQPETDAATVKTMVEAGVPLRTALRRQGWSDSELDQMATDEEDEQAASANLAGAYLAAAEANANRQAAQAAPGVAVTEGDANAA